MFRLKQEILGRSHLAVGELHPASAFAGCDLDFLVGNGTLEPATGAAATLKEEPAEPAADAPAEGEKKKGKK